MLQYISAAPDFKIRKLNLTRGNVIKHNDRVIFSCLELTDQQLISEWNLWTWPLLQNRNFQGTLLCFYNSYLKHKTCPLFYDHVTLRYQSKEFNVTSCYHIRCYGCINAKQMPIIKMSFRIIFIQSRRLYLKINKVLQQIWQDKKIKPNCISITQPTCIIALWNSPSVCGLTVSAETLAPPADWPNMVTRSGFPPNDAIFFFTQSSAALWSHKPKLPVPKNMQN